MPLLCSHAQNRGNGMRHILIARNGRAAAAGHCDHQQPFDGFARQLYGKTLCIDHSQIGKAYVAQFFVDGVPNPGGTSYMAWIDPDAGYSLVP